MKHSFSFTTFLWLLLLTGAICFTDTTEAAVRPRKKARRTAVRTKKKKAPQVQSPMATAILSAIQPFEFGFNGRAEPLKIEDIKTDDKEKVLHIYVNEPLAWQHFDEEKVESVYACVAEQLPEKYEDYDVRIYGKGQLIDELVIGGAEKSALRREWDEIRHHGHAWVTPLNRPYQTDKGLEGRHLSVCASHGRYYEQKEQTWRWQRPRLFCTIEDLLSQTFVVPYLMPMLENAGAVVFSPRERDWQTHEVIVDNDSPQRPTGKYLETQGQHAWQTADSAGFAQLKEVYVDGDNPFRDGTARFVEAQSKSSNQTTATWTPVIPEEGRYAVYVSYQTLPTSVPDAVYTVRHRGQKTDFRVNQQMGGGTWVYLGTFDFAAGESPENCVSLSNHSASHGHISADAVRFGGGMGNIARGDTANLQLSGLPRFLEGARYAAQWAGFPYEDYANKNGANDYAEDINIRSNATNRLARRSAYFPTDSAGMAVPIEAAIALHTDAGLTRDERHIGSLSIYTTDFQEGLMPTGLSRLTSRDMADIVLSQVDNDLRTLYGDWTRRQMYDRNYSESREPRVPGLILEMLSHQNFSDMRLAHDPNFKFSLARAIYKGVLRFIHRSHASRHFVVQPLPVEAPAAYITPSNQQVRVSWTPVEDPLEPTAKPTAYIVYHAQGEGGFDNGTLVHSTHYELDNAQPNVLHRFIITAANDGGQSMPSQEVCAYISTLSPRRLLIVDAFDRLAGPQPFETDSTLGFDMLADPGVPMAVMPGYCGRQVFFDKTGYGREGPNGLGYSGAELEGTIIAGNTLDWSTRHARDIVGASSGTVSIGSCTQKAIGREDFDSRSYGMMDLVFGLERRDGYSVVPTKVFEQELVQTVATFVRAGGNVLVSGAYIGNDMQADDDRLFTRSLLKYDYASTLPADSLQNISGMNLDFNIRRGYCERAYGTPSVDCLAPIAPAFCTMVYGPSQQSAAVAYQGNDYRSLCFGFPLETIADERIRQLLWRDILGFLLP